MIPSRHNGLYRCQGSARACVLNEASLVSVGPTCWPRPRSWAVSFYADEQADGAAGEVPVGKTKRARCAFGGARLGDPSSQTGLLETSLGVAAGDLLPGPPNHPVGSRILSLRFGVRRARELVGPSVYLDMKLTVQTFLTLDGVMQAPGGPDEDPSDTFTHGGWQAPFPDPAVGEFVTELNSHASAFLFGRRTFDIFRGHWPDQTDPANPIATAINSLPKYVVSNSLSEADATWRGEHPDTARLVTGDVVAAMQALKDEPGDELQIWGSSKLLQTLLQHELVDRFRLMTFPLVLGSGRRLFNDGIRPATMRPVDLTVTDLGIVIGTYEPAGPVRHSQM